MNFLAHAYLSFGNPQLVIGNMISDFVKGSSKYNYSKGVQEGIMLHREIDSFTDAHPVTHKAKHVFRPTYRLYSGAIMDIIYDHFLATDEAIFPANTLKDFSQGIYNLLEAETLQLPPVFKQAFHYMKKEDWLSHYREKKGIEKSLKGLVRRAAYLSESETAFQIFNNQYHFLATCYHKFFPDVKDFAKEKIKGMME